MNPFLNWITHLTGQQDVEIIDSLSLTMRWPAWVGLFACACAVAAAVLLYRRVPRLTPLKRRVLTGFRAAAYVCLMLLLLAPILSLDGRGRPSGPLPVVVDRTESMGIRDLEDGTRLDHAVRLARALQEEAGGVDGVVPSFYDYGVEVETLDPDAVDLQPQGGFTSLGEMLTGGLRPHRGVYVPGILLLTDGGHNGGERLDTASAYFTQRGIPVYSIPVGRERPRDVSLNHLIADDIVFVGEKFKTFITLQQTGYEHVPLALQADFGGDPVQVEPPILVDEGEQTLSIEHTPIREGVFDMTVHLPPLDGEATVENNTISRKIQVIKDRIRVLMVFGAPSWEYRFLQGAFERDRRVDDRVFLQSVDPRVFGTNQSRYLRKLPSREELFTDYDMILFSRMDLSLLPKDFLEAAADFVADEGGGLVVCSDGTDIPYSARATPLEPLLPVRLSEPASGSSFKQELFRSQRTPFQLQLLPVGQGYPLVTFHPDADENMGIWNSFPPMFEVCPPLEVKASGLELVQAVGDGNRPAIVFQTYGKGTVLYMGFDSTWRWRREYGDRYFRDFWGRVVQSLGLPHLLGQAAQSHVYADPLQAYVGQQVSLTAAVRNRDFSPYSGGTVTLNGRYDDGTEVSLSLSAVGGQAGVYRTLYYPDREGSLVLSLDEEWNAEPVRVDITKLSQEFRNPGVRMDLLRQLSAETGGQVFTPDAADGADGDPDELTQQARAILQAIADQRPSVDLSTSKTLWDTPLLLILALLLLCVEYLFRRLWYLD